MSTKAIYYLPVPTKLSQKWEFYKVDHEALSQLFTEVIVCNTFWQTIKYLRGTDLIFCWWWNRSTHVVLLAKIFRIKVHVIGAMHMFDLSGSPDYYSKSFLYKLASKITLALADRNYFISNDQFNQATSHLFVNNPVVLRSSLTKDFCFSKDSIVRERDRQRAITRRTTKIIFLTVVWHRLDQYKRKGVFETLTAISTLKENTALDFEWIVIGGEGDGVEVLRSRIFELKLENHVSVHTNVSPEDKIVFFFNADLYIQPSWHEGFGNAVLEAMSHGLPALVSRYTAQPEVVGPTGYMVMEITPDCIYEQLIKFIDLDDVQRLKMIDNVLNRVENFFSFTNRINLLADILTSSNINFNLPDRE